MERLTTCLENSGAWRSRMAPQRMNSGVSMAHRFGPLVAPAVGGKKSEPLEPEDHALGRSRGGFGTKLHILCDSAGHPLHFELSAGHVHDSKMFGAVLDGADDALYWESGRAMPWPLALSGDKGYRANHIDQVLLNLGINPVIPSKANENRDTRPIDFDKDAYRRRAIVECLIGWLKESRRVMTRFEKTAINFAGMVKLACIDRYLRNGPS